MHKKMEKALQTAFSIFISLKFMPATGIEPVREVSPTGF